MNIKNLYENRKFYKKILLWTIVVSTSVIIIFSTSLYYKIKDNHLNNEYEANKKVLYQVMFNINYIDDIVSNIGIPLFLSPQITSIMYNNEVDVNDLYNELNMIKTNILSTTPFIKTIYIYNNKLKMFYSNKGSIGYNDSDLKNIIDSVDEISSNKPILRKSGNSYFITYIIYEFKKKNNIIDGALIIDADIDWLLKNLKSINMIDDNQSDEIFLLDNEYQFINSGSHNNEFMTSIRNSYLKHITNATNSEKTQGFFKSNIENIDYLITYMPVIKASWVLIKIQPYNIVFKNVQDLKYVFLIITIAIIVLTIIVSVFASRGIYRPIGTLVKQVSSSEMNEFTPNNIRDEITFLNEAYTYSSAELKKYRSQMNSYKDIVKVSFLKKMFSDSFSITDDELKKMQQDYDLNISMNGIFIVCVIKIDDYKVFQEKFSYKDRELYKFAMINIFNEIIAESYENVAVDLKTDHISIIINVKEDDEYCSRLKAFIIKAQESYYKYFNISLSATISEPETDLRQITTIYNRVLNNSMYRLVYGKMSIITEYMVSGHNENTLIGYPESLCKKLEEAIMMENPGNAENIIKSILGEISKLNYNNIMLSIISLINMIKSTIDEINTSKLVPVQINFNSIISNILNTETLEELNNDIINLLGKIMQHENYDKENNKKAFLVDTIKSIIYEKYYDSSICLQNIALTLNMSQKYISKIFKANMSISIPDYINQVRLGKALELLENPKLDIGDIALKIGMENENYFYTLFKKKYGVTPREYFLNRTIKRAKDDK